MNVDTPATDWSVSFEIPGHQPRKSNSRRIVWSKGASRSIKSAKAMRFEEETISWLKAHPKYQLDIACAVYLEADIYYPNAACDLSDELLSDALEKGGVIRNDNLIRRKNIYWAGLDKENPRIAVRLSPIAGYPKQWINNYKSKADLAIVKAKRGASGG